MRGSPSMRTKLTAYSNRLVALRPAGRGDHDLRALHGHEVVQPDERHQRRLAVAPGQRHDDLARTARERAHDPALEWL